MIFVFPGLFNRLKRLFFSLRLREVVGDEVGALEEQENVAEAVTLQRAVEGDPVGVLEGTQRHKP